MTRAGEHACRTTFAAPNVGTAATVATRVWGWRRASAEALNYSGRDAYSAFPVGLAGVENGPWRDGCWRCGKI